jgi:polar amino acid transport system substrate-binding protein
MRKSLRLTALASIAVLMVAACGAGATPTPAPTAVPTEAAPVTAAPTAAPATPTPAPTYDPNGLLGKVVAAGKIRISTDPNYAPFSFYDTATGKYTGFDSATAEETAKRLSAAVGKEIAIEWVTPGWDLITAGSWGGRWDISIGSMGITKGRAKVVDFVDPYFFDFGAVAVPTDSPVQALSELAGKNICVGVASIYEQWLTGTLEIVDPNLQPVPPGLTITSLTTENECVQAIAAGRTFDAIAASVDVLTDAEKQGQPIRVLAGPPTTTTSVAFALDRSGPPTAAMLAVLNKIVGEMHADGTLKAISMKWLEKDVTSRPE